jgi:2-methylcitrate dehydratase PrpD
MAGRETERLVDYVASLRYEDIPADVVRAAKNTIVDGVAACAFGYGFPWSQAVLRAALRMGGGGGICAVLGPDAPALHAPFAALVNGALAHSFELDGGTRKGVGAHPFGTVFTAALPVAQEVGASGRDLITAFVAGSEALLRIGKATGRSNEHRGFHAPGTTGPFGAAIACSLLKSASRDQLLNAVGIAGSLASGLRQFSKSSTGGMVKRLHFGRAAEAGVLAASLAQEGFDGPHDVLEGKAGFLRVFCDSFDVDELVRGLDRETFCMREISMKHFATHGSTQAPLKSLLELFDRHTMTSAEISSVTVVASRESVENHDGRAPKDLMQAQYSIPFCIALACMRDIRDPRSMREDALADPGILQMLSRVNVEIGDFDEKRTCLVRVRHVNRETYETFSRDDAASWRPASDAEVTAKYGVLMRDVPADRSAPLLTRLQRLEAEDDVDWLRV